MGHRKQDLALTLSGLPIKVRVHFRSSLAALNEQGVYTRLPRQR
jgi:hypothetical protein